MANKIETNVVDYLVSCVYSFVGDAEVDYSNNTYVTVNLDKDDNGDFWWRIDTLADGTVVGIACCACTKMNSDCTIFVSEYGTPNDDSIRSVYELVDEITSDKILEKMEEKFDRKYMQAHKQGLI